MSRSARPTILRINVVPLFSSASHTSSGSLTCLFVGLLLMSCATAFPVSSSNSSKSTATTEPPSAQVNLGQSSIHLFEDSDYKGIRSSLYVGPSTCVNLMGKLNDFYSSADTLGSCFYLCEHQNCRGKCSQIVGRVSRLARIGVNDRISSIRLCNELDSIKKNRRNSSTSPYLAGRLFSRRRTRRSLDQVPKLPANFQSLSRRARREIRFTSKAGDELPLTLGEGAPLANNQYLTGRAIRRRRTGSSQSSEERQDVYATILNGRHPRNHQGLVRIPRHRKKRKGLRSEKLS